MKPTRANRPLPQRLDSPAAALLVVSLLVSLFTFGMLRRNGFDPSSFVVAGDMFSTPGLVPANLRVSENSSGYDGQFYYRLALDPFTSESERHGVRFDNSPYRQQRILYPLLAWALALGTPGLVPAALLLVNVLALCLMGWAGAAYAQSLGRHALWGVLLPLYPGFLFTLSRDLVEILEVALLTCSLLLVSRGRHPPATALLALAVLAKETALLVAVGAALAYAYGALRGAGGRALRWYYFAAPLLVYALWQFALHLNWGKLAVRGGGHNIGPPFAAVASFFAEVASLQTHTHRRWFVELLALLAFALVVVYQYRRSCAPPLVKLSWPLYAALAVTLTRSVWVEDWAFMRAVSEFYVLGAVIVVGGGLKARAAVFACALAAWVLLAYGLIFMDY